MARIRRGRETVNFTVLSNQLIRDARLSWRATGVLVFLLSLPPEVGIDSVDLARMRREGREAVRTALRELVDAGYMERTKYRDERGRWCTDMEVRSTPVLPDRVVDRVLGGDGAAATASLTVVGA